MVGLYVTYKSQEIGLIMYMEHIFKGNTEKRAVHLYPPLRATPFRLIAVIALLISFSEAAPESTLTISKSTGTQQNLGIALHGKHKNFI